MPRRKGNEFRINQYVNGTHQNPSIAYNKRRGGYMVVWEGEGQEDSHGIYGHLFDNQGNPEGSNFLVNTVVNNSQFVPSVASFINGHYMVVWTSVIGVPGNDYDVFGQIIDYILPNKLGNEFQVNTGINFDQSTGAKSIAAVPPGAPTVSSSMVVWNDNNDPYDIAGRIFYLNSTALTGEFFINNNLVGSQGTPSISALPASDNFVVTWRDELGSADLSGTSISARLFNGTDNSWIGNQFPVNTYTANLQLNPDVSSFPSPGGNGSEGFVIVWDSFGQDTSSEGIYGQIFNINGSKRGNEFQVNTYTLGAQKKPRVAGLSSGKFVVVWQSEGQDGSGYGVYGQIFNNDATKFGAEFLVNTDTMGDQINPMIDTNINTEEIFVVWESSGQNAFSPGIYGQLFDGTKAEPQLVNNQLAITEGQTIFLNSTNLSAIDVDNANTDLLIFTVRNIKGGFFDLISNPAVPVTNFTQQQIKTNQVRFTQDGSHTLSYEVSVNDSDGLSTPFIPATITFTYINDAPVIVNNRLTVTEGQPIILTSADLSATDEENLASALTFTVSDVQAGRFEFIFAAGTGITSFTQQQITNGQVRFVPDGSRTAPSYKVSISDGQLTTVPSAATVNFITLTPTPTPTPTTTPTPTPININQVPVVTNPLQNKTVTVDQPFDFMIPNNTFADPDGDTLSYSATQTNGSALPSWVTFKNDSLTFSGKAPSAGTNRFSLFARDPGNLSARADFSLTAENAPASDSSLSLNAIVGISVGVTVGAALIAGGAATFYRWKNSFWKKEPERAHEMVSSHSNSAHTDPQQTSAKRSSTSS